MTKISPPDTKLGLRCRAARLAAGLTQTDAGNCLGVTFQQVQKQENGTNRVSCVAMAKLAKLYGKPVEWFFEGIADPAPVSQDLGLELLTIPGGSDLATAFLAIPNSSDRQAALAVVRAMGRK